MTPRLTHDRQDVKAAQRAALPLTLKVDSPREGSDHRVRRELGRLAALRGGRELDHLGGLRERTGRCTHRGDPEEGRSAGALARRGDRRPHDPAPGKGTLLGVIISRALQAERRLTSGDSLRIAAILTLAAVVVAGAAQSAVDAGEYGSLWDGVWWAVVTVTTVGYGDLYPKTVQGRLIGIVLMFVGIGFLSLLTASIASRFVKQERSDEHVEMMEALRRLQADVAEMKARTSLG